MKDEQRRTESREGLDEQGHRDGKGRVGKGSGRDGRPSLHSALCTVHSLGGAFIVWCMTCGSSAAVWLKGPVRVPKGWERKPKVQEY